MITLFQAEWCPHSSKVRQRHLAGLEPWQWAEQHRERYREHRS